MTEQEQKMMFAAFALAGLLARAEADPFYAVPNAWKLAKRMIEEQPQENEDE